MAHVISRHLKIGYRYNYLVFTYISPLSSYEVLTA